MRVLFLSSIFPTPYHATRGIFNLELLRAMAREHEVEVVSPLAWTDELAAMRRRLPPLPPDRSVSTHGFTVHYPRYYHTPKLLRSYYASFMWASVGAYARRVADQSRPDVVLSYWAHPDGAVAARLARGLGIPSLLMVGGSDILLLTRSRRRRKCIDDAVHASDALIAVSRDLVQKLAAFGVPDEKIHLVERGIDSSVFFKSDQCEARRRLGIPQKERVLVWVGRMVPVKGLDVLIDACSRLKDGGVKFSLHLVGSGPLLGWLESEVKRRDLANEVHFAGAKSHADLADYYRAADATVLPSLSEGIPNVLRESLACGTPFVASRVGGIPEIAQDPRVRLVPPGDPVALADGLREVCTGGLGGEPVESPTADWSQCARSVVRIMRQAVEAAQPAAPLRSHLPVPVQG